MKLGGGGSQNLSQMEDEKMAEFSAQKISDKVYWVGAVDWLLRDFHGYSTHRGSTYNAYLILDEEPILIDTVKAPFCEEMLARIKSVIAPEKIKYIVSNHAEMDHSGSLPQLLKICQPKKVFASKVGVQALSDHFHFPTATITPVQNGETITLGKTSLQFIETKMLHWPESMFTYFIEDKILFSQDAFGMHFATRELFSDLCDKNILIEEAGKYFANILTPYSALVTNLFNVLSKFSLDIKMIAPVHGPIWRTQDDIKFILEKWQKWAHQEVYPKVVIIYDTMWQSTAKMAAAIADGVAEVSGITVKILPLSASSRSDVALELLEAGALLVGSPTLNQQIFPTVADVLCYLQGLKRKNLIGQAFGSYGWGNEGIKILQDTLLKMNISSVGEAAVVRYVPTDENFRQCIALGKKVATVLKSKCVS